MLHGWHSHSWNLHYPVFRRFFLLTSLSVWFMMLFLEQALKPQRNWGFPLLPSCMASHSSCASVWKTACGIHQQVTPALCWSRCLHKASEANALTIPSQAIHHVHGTDFPNLQNPTCMSEPQKQPSSPRALLCTKPSCPHASGWCAGPERAAVQSPTWRLKSFHPWLLLFTNAEGWKHMNGQGMGIYDAIWVPAHWSRCLIFPEFYS